MSPALPPGLTSANKVPAVSLESSDSDAKSDHDDSLGGPPQKKRKTN